MKVFRITGVGEWYTGEGSWSKAEDEGTIYRSLDSAEYVIRTGRGGNYPKPWLWADAEIVTYELVKMVDTF